MAPPVAGGGGASERPRTWGEQDRRSRRGQGVGKFSGHSGSCKCCGGHHYVPPPVTGTPTSRTLPLGMVCGGQGGALVTLDSAAQLLARHRHPKSKDGGGGGSDHSSSGVVGARAYTRAGLLCQSVRVSGITSSCQTVL